MKEYIVQLIRTETILNNVGIRSYQHLDTVSKAKSLLLGLFISHKDSYLFFTYFRVYLYLPLSLCVLRSSSSQQPSALVKHCNSA